MSAKKKSRSPSKKQATQPFIVVWIILGIILGASIMYTLQTLRALPFFQEQGTTNKQNAKITNKPQDDLADFVFEYPDKLTEEVPVYEYQIPKPKKETTAETTPKKTAPQKHEPVNMIIQVGSFRNFTDADRMKAKLAFIGIEAVIQRVRLDKNERWHRVRITHFDNLNDFALIRKRLKENNINYFVFKVKS